MRKKLLLLLLCTLTGALILTGCSAANDILGAWYAYAEEKDGEIYHKRTSDEELIFDFRDKENVDVYMEGVRQNTAYILDGSILKINIDGKIIEFTVKSVDSSELVLHYLKENTLWHLSRISRSSLKDNTDDDDSSKWKWPYPVNDFWPEYENDWWPDTNTSQWPIVFDD